MGFNWFKILLGLAVVLLFVQFCLGMYINLYVTLPMYQPLNFSSYSGGTLVLTHLVTGVLVLALAGLIVSYSVRCRERLVCALAVLGFAFAVVAAGTGYTFAVHSQDSSLSMAMAVSFLVIYTIYFSMFHLTSRIRP
jgi:CDP-diglyceride synthetase